MKKDDYRILKIKGACVDLRQANYYIVHSKELDSWAYDGSSTDYSLHNHDSGCWEDLCCELEGKYDGLAFEIYADVVESIHIDEDNSEQEALEEAMRTDMIQDIRESAKRWLEKNEWNDEPLYWNWLNGGNWHSCLIFSNKESINRDTDLELLAKDSSEAARILEAAFRSPYPGLEFEEGRALFCDKETGISFIYSQWQGEPGIAAVYDPSTLKDKGEE